MRSLYVWGLSDRVTVIYINIYESYLILQIFEYESEEKQERY